MKFRAHRDVVAACTRQAEGHARCNRGLPRFRVTRRHPQVALETVCAIAAIVIDRLAALTVRGRIKPLAGRSKALLVGHTATPEGSPAAARAGRESASWTSGSRRVRTTAQRGVRSVPFWNTCRPTQRQGFNELFSTYYIHVQTCIFTGGILSGSHAGGAHDFQPSHARSVSALRTGTLHRRLARRFKLIVETLR